MKLVLVLFSLIPSLSFAADENMVSFKNLVVEKHQKFNFTGREGVLVKFQGVKREAYFPLDEKAQNVKFGELVEKSAAEKAPLNIKVMRLSEGVVSYHNQSGNIQVLAFGEKCRKTI